VRYDPFPSDVRSQCKKMTLKKDLIGGRIKAGTVIWAYHKFRIYVPKPDAGAEPKEAARFEFDGQLFDDFFEPVKDPNAPKTPKSRVANQKPEPAPPSGS
jgi:hypothetical protein